MSKDATTEYKSVSPGGGGGGGGAVSSVFGRVGAVLAVLGDYAASKITNDATGVTGSNVKLGLEYLLGLINTLSSNTTSALSGKVNTTDTLTDTQHGSRSGGALHANVVAAGAAGFMTGADKTKLDGIGTGANAIGAASSTDNALTRWDGTGGKTIQDSAAFLDDSGQLGVGTSVPTHAITLASGKAETIYNTADQTTNYERVRAGFSANVAQFVFEKGGSGSSRTVQVGNAAQLNTTSWGSSGGITHAANTAAGATGAHAFSNASPLNSTAVQQAHAVYTCTVNQTSGTGGLDVLVLNPTITAVGSGGVNLIRCQDSGTDVWKLDRFGKVTQSTTTTAAGTTGARTINTPTGTVNIAAAGTSVVVTNSLVSATSLVWCVVRTADSTAYIKNVVPSAGSFTVNLGAAATAEVSIGFFVIN